MAIRTIVTCDVHADDTTEGEPVLVGLFGSDYEIDLCEEHRDELVSLLEPYMELARPQDQRQPARETASKTTRSRRRTTKTNTSDVRAWARQQGYEVSDRGRIPVNIVSEYEQAQGGSGRTRRRAK